MPFKVFGGSLGLLFGAPGGLLGALLVLLGRLDGTPNVSNIYLGTLEPPFCPPRSPQRPQTAPQAPYVHLKWLFFLSWNLLVSILTFQEAPPTFKNLDFASAGARF